MSILHLAEPGPITEDFFPFIENYFDCSDHKLLSFTRAKFRFNPAKINVIKKTGKIKSIINFYIHSYRAKKIIIHGLFGWHLPLLLALNPWVLKRCYWVIWGGDLYYHSLRVKNFRSNLFEIARKYVIKRIGNLVSYIDGDVNLAREWYGASGDYHHCLMYPSNVFHALEASVKDTNDTAILVGNSADPSNNHYEIFKKLEKLNLEKIKIYCPLSYGDAIYADQVATKGYDLFGDRFVALRNMMPVGQYLRLLANVDIAIFAHKRQQAMGNTIALLGLGKKVYIRNDVTTWKLFADLNVRIFDVEKLNFSPMATKEKEINIKKINDYFSNAKLVSQWGKIFR